jgi:hypothetical protein
MRGCSFPGVLLRSTTNPIKLLGLQLPRVPSDPKFSAGRRRQCSSKSSSQPGRYWLGQGTQLNACGSPRATIAGALRRDWSGRRVRPKADLCRTVPEVLGSGERCAREQRSSPLRERVNYDDWPVSPVRYSTLAKLPQQLIVGVVNRTGRINYQAFCNDMPDASRSDIRRKSP